MRRYFINNILSLNTEVELSGDLFHHICEVCRQDVDSQFELITPQGMAFFVRLKQRNKKSALVSVLEERVIKKRKDPQIHLVLSVPKIPTLETIMEKAVELGVSSIIPVISDFSFFKSLDNFPQQKWERWQKILIGATQQSGRGDLLVLHKPEILKNWLKAVNLNSSSRGLFSYEGESVLKIQQALKSLHTEHNIKDLYIFVGSEGGFSHDEVSLFQSLDLQPVTLGDQVLRVETACVTLVANVKYEFEL